MTKRSWLQTFRDFAGHVADCRAASGDLRPALLELADSLDLQAVAHYRSSSDGRYLTRQWVRGEELGLPCPPLLAVGSGLCGTVAAKRSAITCFDIQTSAEPMVDELRQSDLQLYVGFPLCVDDRLIGTLAFASTTREALSEAELDLLHAVAAMLAMAIDREQLAAQADARATELRGTADELERTVAVLDSILTTLPSGFALFDRNLRYVRINQALATMNNLPVDAHLGKSMAECLPHVAGMTEPFIRRVMHTGEPILNLELSGQQHLTGKAMHCLASYYPVRTSTHELLGVGVLVVDITDRRLVEDTLRESEARFRTMGDSAPVLIWMSGTDNMCYWFNRQWLDFTGQTMDEQAGTGWLRSVHPDDQAAVDQTFRTACAGRTPFRMEYRLCRHDGIYRWMLDQGVPRYGPSGTFQGYIGSCIDITDLRDAREVLTRQQIELESRVKERTEELIDANQQLAISADELRRSNAELQQFAYVASHDLQEPLRTITSFTQLLGQRYKNELAGDAQTYMEFIIQAAGRMQRLIQALLTYSRVGSTGVRRTPTELAQVARDAVASLAHAIAECGAEVNIADLPTLSADATQLTQLLQNLIANALKFRRQNSGDPPRVTISATRLNDAWRISVADNGIGIEARHLDRIFQIFQRLHTDTRYPGSGIGLAICKKIAEQHGGQIWAESTPGQGSTFHFTIADPD